MPMPYKPRTSLDLYNASVSMNNKIAAREERKNALKARNESVQHREANSILEASYKRDTLQRKYAIFSEDLKFKLLTYAISEVAGCTMDKINNMMGKPIFSSRENANMNAMIYNFVHENGGASNVLYNMTRLGTTQYLSELAKLVKSTHKSMLEFVEKDDPDSFHVGDGAMKDYKDSVHNTFGHDELVDSIAERVAESIKEFITQNADDKEKIITAMNATKNKVESLKPDASEELKECYTNMGRRLVNDIRERPHGLFNEMVIALSRSVLRSQNEAVREKFIDGAHLNMESVMTGVATMYTLLETANTMKLAKIDRAYIDEMLTSMAKDT